MRIFLNRKSIEIDARKVSFLRRGIGLMFRSKETEPLLFEFNNDGKRAITSFFVFFPFLAVWLDEKDRVVELKKILPFEFSIRPKRAFRKLVEIPFNHKNEKIISFFVGKRKI